MCQGSLVHWVDQIANNEFLLAKERDVSEVP